MVGTRLFPQGSVRHCSRLHLLHCAPLSPQSPLLFHSRPYILEFQFRIVKCSAQSPSLWCCMCVYSHVGQEVSPFAGVAGLATQKRKWSIYSTYRYIKRYVKCSLVWLCRLGAASAYDTEDEVTCYQPYYPLTMRCVPCFYLQSIMGKVKLPLCLTNSALRHEGLWESDCIDPRFLDLGTSWRWGVSFTPRPLYPRRKSPRYPLDRRLGGPQSRSGRRGEDKILVPTGTRTPTPWSSSP
jgi:hypothetical protein